MFRKYFGSVWIALAAIGLIVAAYSVAGPSALASRWDQRTFITVDHSFVIGQTELPAGTYVIKLAYDRRSYSGPKNLVRIMSADEKTVFATVFGTRDVRLKAADNTEVSFHEVEGKPPMMHGWFYAGEHNGLQFCAKK